MNFDDFPWGSYVDLTDGDFKVIPDSPTGAQIWICPRVDEPTKHLPNQFTAYRTQCRGSASTARRGSSSRK